MFKASNLGNLVYPLSHHCDSKCLKRLSTEILEYNLNNYNNYVTKYGGVIMTSLNITRGYDKIHFCFLYVCTSALSFIFCKLIKLYLKNHHVCFMLILATSCLAQRKIIYFEEFGNCASTS